MHRWIPIAALLHAPLSAAAATPLPSAVDFRYAPPEWQTAICLPDDPHKTLVDRSGELLYHYHQGGREFGTRLGVEVVPDARWERQELLSPRLPIVRTFRTADGLEILEEAFALTGQQPVTTKEPALRRLDGTDVNRDWAHPPAGFSPSLRDIALHYGGPLEFEYRVPAGARKTIALALCEGWWAQAGRRLQVLRVEGAEPRLVDTVADLGQNRPGAFWFAARDADGDGRITLRVEAAPLAGDQNTILNSLWVFSPAQAEDSTALLRGALDAAAEARLEDAAASGPVRGDVLLVHVTNRGTTPRALAPALIVDTALPFHFDAASGRAVVNATGFVTGSLPPTGTVETSGPRRRLPLESLTVPAGRTARFFVLHGSGGRMTGEPATVKQALAARDRAVRFWEHAPLPFGRVTVPDPGVQALVDSAIRNIWQAREIKKGLPAFQVGPTCYRGLWIVDGAFLLEAAALVGAGREARSGVAYELTWQQPDGRIEVMKNFSKENGIVLWTCTRHARLTQDQAWLESVWPRLERIAGHLRTLRQQTLTNASTLDDGLVPAGFPDGGIGGVMDEYTNPYWNLAGLRAFIEGAHWLGKTHVAAEWQRDYDDFLDAYRRAARRDLKTDPHGHAYVPIRMDGQDLPQRAQWAFCHAVYPGQVFAHDDPLVASTLAMLEATERQGMVYGTGWDATGIWNYFASFYGHAWLWQGRGDKAAGALEAFANHAAPTLVWREEQSLRGEPFKKVGDMPHNWASAEFIRLTIHLLALDRGSELHLLEGLPPAWLGPGMLTRLEGVATPFGPLRLTLQVDPRGATASVSVKPLDASCTDVVVHLPDGSTQRLDPRKGGRLRFAVK